MHRKSLFIFRRDFRVYDNTGLIECLAESETVIPIFIFTPTQLKKNPYKSENCVQFMMESLEDLERQLKQYSGKLFYFYGEPFKVIETILLDDDEIDAVYVNTDYTPYSKQRDDAIYSVCKKYNIEFAEYEDVLLNMVASITTSSDNTVYEKFTPYFNKAKKEPVDKPVSNTAKNYATKINSKTYEKSIHLFYKNNNNILIRGGRTNALQRLKKAHNFKDYNKKRDDLTYETTRLSAYIKFGCVSIREVYNTFKKKLGMNNDLIKQLYWRDFYYNIAYSHPRVFKKDKNLKEKYDKIKWKNNKTEFNKWKNAETGFPIVDACMTEMNKTGYMHNRGRLIVSSFVIKLLQIDWKWGEKYFAQTLVDYDMSVNNGNWGWSSGSGADSQPYFRIFNPWSQSEKHDKDAKYIKKWIPALKDVPAKHLHKWDKHYKDYNVDYPSPMIDYEKERDNAFKMYKKAFK